MRWPRTKRPASPRFLSASPLFASANHQGRLRLFAARTLLAKRCENEGPSSELENSAQSADGAGEGTEYQRPEEATSTREDAARQFTVLR
jgi:hypothetical protein